MSMAPKPDNNVAAEISKILEFTQRPGGYGRLTIAQRRLLLITVLTAIVPIDGKILEVEISHLRFLLKARYGMGDGEIEIAIACCLHAPNRKLVVEAARQLVNLLSMEDRIALVGQLWDLALCDHNLHGDEEALIYELADCFEVPRKRVIEQQARAVAQFP